MSKYRKRSRKFSYKNIVKRRRTQENSDDENRLYATYPFIFQSFNVYILSVNLGAARRYVLANLVCKYGGRVSYCVTDNTSHVLVDENVTSAAVCQALEWTTYPPHINVVLASWVSACIRANYCLDASDYELPCTHKPTFVSHHNRLILWRNQQKRSESDFRETDRGSGVSNEMTRANVDGEVSPFDDGLYEVETSCDDSWLYEITPHPVLFDYLAPQRIKKARSGSEQINSAASKQCNPVCKGSPLRGFKRRRRDSRIVIQNKSVVVAPAAKSNACPDGGTVSENKESINNRAISISSATASLQSVNDEKAKISASSVEYTELKQSFPEGERNSPSCSPLNLSKSFNSGDLIGMIKSNTTEVSDTAAAQSSMEISTTTADRSLKAENLSVKHFQSYQLKHTFKNEMAEDLTSREIPLIWKKEYLKCEKLELDHKNSEHTQTSSSDVKASSIGYANTFVNVSVTVSSSRICNSVSVEHSELEPANHEIKNEELTAVEYKKQVSLASELTPQNLSLSKRKQNLIDEKSVSEKSFALETFKISNFKLDDKVSSRKNYCKTSVPNLDGIESVSGIKPLSSVVTCFTEQRSLNIPKVDTKCQSFSFPSTSSNSLWSSGPSTSKSFFVDGPSTSNNSLCVAGPSTSTDTLYVAGPSTSTDTLYVAGPSTSSDDSLCAAGSSTSNNSFCVAGPSSSISNSLCIASPSFSFSNSLCIVGPSKKKLFFDKVKPKSTYIYSEHPNSLAIKTLQLLYDIFKKRKDNMRIHAYEKAIIALRKRKQAITSLEEAKSTNGIGRKIANKVWEIIQTGHLKEIEEISCNQRAKTLRLFRAAWGINSLTADALYKEGYLTIQDLRTKSDLSRAHQIGLRYFDDLKLKMPRKEAEKILNLVMSVIFGLYSFVQCDACSSLRRNRQFCGHIEILVSLPEGRVNDHKILPEIIAKLHQDGYLIDDLVRHEENGAQTRYVGIIKLSTAGAKYRRIGITVCNREEYACALMYLTGSAYFNKAVRQVAFKKNMILDEHSLRRKTVREDRGLVYEVLATPSEADIFLHLNIPFRVPEIRDRPLTLEAT